jgi:hypothetical protein
MALFVAKSILQAAQGGAQTKRFREFVVAHFEGEGAIAVPNTVWQPVAAWAAARQPSGNRMRDRGMLLQRLDVLVTRRGTTIVSTCGGMIPLARLRNSMKSEGLDLKEWNFPPQDILDRALDPNAGKEAEAEEAGEVPVAEEPAVFTRVDAQRVRNSAGFEVRIIDQYTAEYIADSVADSAEGPLRAVIRGVPGMVGGRPGFKVKLDALSFSRPVTPAERSRALSNFSSAMDFQKISVML